MFSQNVFGLEPATVRVREVRIGRAERRAARRRARELRSGETPVTENDPNGADDDLNMNISLELSMSQTLTSADGDTGPSVLVPAISPEGPPTLSHTSTVTTDASQAAGHAEELVALSSAQMGQYTTFQQLSFAPRFPLASIADDYIIPPTYPQYLQHREQYEPGSSITPGTAGSSQVQFSPPGLPVPAISPPTRWFYRDPKGVVHGWSFFSLCSLVSRSRSIQDHGRQL
jgi:hypothetical protein